MSTHALEMAVESVPSSVARIRRFTTDACRVTSPAVDCDTVALLVSEVATNALIHGAGQVRVRVEAVTLGVRVEVADGSPVLPARRQATPLDEGGRGIALVEAFSTAWGSQPTPSGKTVWFEVTAR